MDLSLGFIGTGNMGQAMIGGILKNGVLQPDQIFVYDSDKQKLDTVHKTFGVRKMFSEADVCERAEMIVFTIKPNIYESVMESIKDNIDDSKIIVTVAPGKTLKDMQEIFGKDSKIIRTMPNTPALVKEGMTALCPNENIRPSDIMKVKTVFESFGRAEIVSEKIIEPIIGISGSSPAYVFMFIEAMADAAVLHGMDRDLAYKFAAQSVMGSAKMLLETQLHPGELKDMVCSPGGTTIAAVTTLEESGFRAAVIKGVKSCIAKANEMNKPQ